MGLSTKIAARYLCGSSTGKTIKIITLISILGIMLSVASLVTSYSIAGGFKDAYERSILSFNSHIILSAPTEISNYAAVIEKVKNALGDELENASPFLWRETLIVAGKEVRGVVFKGSPNEYIKRVSGITLKDGEVVIGSSIADEAGIKIGDTVRVLVSVSNGAPQEFKELVVAGFFDSGMYEFDSQFVLMEIDSERRLFGAGDIASGIELRLRHPNRSESASNALMEVLDYPIQATSWEEINKDLVKAMKLEKLGFSIIMGLFIIVASFNIMGTTVMHILQKATDISILRAIGMPGRDIRLVFLYQGLLIGMCGVLSGILVSSAIVWSIQKFKWIKIPKEVYLLSSLPVSFSWKVTIAVFIFGVFVCFLASLVSSKRVLELPITKELHRL